MKFYIKFASYVNLNYKNYFNFCVNRHDLFFYELLLVLYLLSILFSANTLLELGPFKNWLCKTLGPLWNINETSNDGILIVN